METRTRRVARVARVGMLAALAVACGTSATVVQGPGPRLAVGTWGGENAGVIVDDTIAHVHVGCTFGNFAGPVVLDGTGRFDVAGSYVPRAYPVTQGPSVPARFRGTVTGAGDGASLTLTVAVDDTVLHTSSTLGPVTVTLGRDPRMGPCPICAKPRALP
jgi:hypothetical protein